MCVGIKRLGEGFMGFGFLSDKIGKLLKKKEVLRQGDEEKKVLWSGREEGFQKESC